MNSETFKLRKKFLEEFYNRSRIRFLRAPNIYIYIHNDTHNNIHDIEDNIFHIKSSACICNEYSSLDINSKDANKLIKPFIYYLYSVTYHNKFLRDQLLFFDKITISYSYNTDQYDYYIDYNMEIAPDTLYEDNNFLKFINVEKVNEGLNLNLNSIRIRLNTIYEFESHLQYAMYVVELDDDEIINNIPENDEKIINSSQTYKSDECVICLSNPSNILFCNCGHIAICTECDKLKKLNASPICKTENKILRCLE